MFGRALNSFVGIHFPRILAMYFLGACACLKHVICHHHRVQRLRFHIMGTNFDAKRLKYFHRV